jgi:hypothetical protein
MMYPQDKNVLAALTCNNENCTEKVPACLTLMPILIASHGARGDPFLKLQRLMERKHPRVTGAPCTLCSPTEGQQRL